MEKPVTTSVKDEIATTRAELKHWTDLAQAHPEWRSPPVHVRGLKAHLKWLYSQPPQKHMMFQSFRYNYWKGNKK